MSGAWWMRERAEECEIREERQTSINLDKMIQLRESCDLTQKDHCLKCTCPWNKLWITRIAKSLLIELINPFILDTSQARFFSLNHLRLHIVFQENKWKWLWNDGCSSKQWICKPVYFNIFSYQEISETLISVKFFCCR